MKTLAVLIVLVIATAAAFVTRPQLKDQQAHADALFAGKMTEPGGPAYVVRAGKYQDFLVGTKFTSSTGDRVLVTCWGAFGNFLCIEPDAKPAAGNGIG